MDSSRTHYGHSGIVEAARDLFTQIEGDPGGKSLGYNVKMFITCHTSFL